MQVDRNIPLSGPQKEAVGHKDGPLLVAAGAGSGKTRTLTERLIRLIETGTDPNAIVAITFTNKAAGEMRERIMRRLAPEGRVAENRLPFIGTFHSFGARILRRHARLLGRTPSFVIFDDDDAKRVVKKVAGSFDLPSAQTLPKIRREISRVKNNLVDPDLLDHAVRGVFDAYEEALLRQNAFDFDDLLEKAVRLFNEHEGILETYQKKYTHVLVDEYQDINQSQYVFLKLLALRHRNLTVVGDDQQSIYGFRWSDFTNFLNFERDWPDAKIIHLGENYRSTANIVLGAAGVIENNKLQRPKKLFTKNSAGEPIAVTGADSQEEEADVIAGRIEPLGARRGEAAILYRTNAQSRAIEQALNFRSIPYQIFGSVRFYDRKEIRDIVAALRYASNPKDEISRERVEKTFRKAVAAELVERLPGAAEKLDLLELLGYVLKTTDYFTYLGAKFDNAEERAENVGELVQFASTFSALPEFLERVTLLQATDTIREEPERAAKLMTIHLAKGLEFEWVYIAGVSEGLLPHQRSLFSDEDLEEERRLAYVAMTRAKKHLHMSFYGFASRFLYEIPPELVEFKADNAYEREIVLD